MKKIQQIAIKSSYKAIDVSYIKIGDTIWFDCYVKRFKNFVIIIEASTVINEHDFKLLQNTEKHYTKSSEYDEYKKFISKYNEIILDENITEEESEKNLLDCSEIKVNYFNDMDNLENKYKIIYNTLIEIMKNYFNGTSEINQICITELINFYILSLKKDHFIFKNMLEYISHENKHEVHSVNVFVLSSALANYLDYPIDKIQLLGIASILHDIGKKDIDNSIYQKKGSLSDNEYEEIKKHSDLSYKAAKDMNIENKTILNIILHHHEYLDGTGYPSFLKGRKISSLTQIVSVCDVFDAMTSERSFHNKKNAFETLKIMKAEYANKLNAKYIDDLIKLFSKTYS